MNRISEIFARFGLGPLHYISSRYDFGFEFAKKFVLFEKRLPYRWVGELLLIYNKLQNLISQKLKKLFEPKFQGIFLYTYTASSANLSFLALS